MGHWFYPFIKVRHLFDDTDFAESVVLVGGDSCDESPQYRDLCYHQHRPAKLRCHRH